MDLTLNEYQRVAAETDEASDNVLVPLLGLAGEVGALLAEFKKEQLPGGTAYRGFQESVTTELGDILWYLAAVARRLDLPLTVVARQNLDKTRARWLHGDPRARASFDDGFPPEQRLPRCFTAEFTSYEEDGRVLSRMRIEGENVGAPIDDNARYPDHYRFHDVFHLSYAAGLGWSPILRALLRRKRKADPQVDRAEDGARAAACEEAVAALVFEMAKPYDHFAGAQRVDDKILDAVRAVTAGLEVSARTPAEWEQAILSGFAVWRQLRERGEGRVDVDLDAGTVRLRD